MPAALVQGYDDLEVVGESYYQAELWRLVGGRGRVEVRVRMDIHAVLVAEDDNAYDANAIAVWIQGFKVGHLSRENAQLLRPGLLSLQIEQRKPVALAGVITGGGMREDGPGRLGVFLRYDHEAFGLRRPNVAIQADARLRTALTDTLANSKGSSYNLTWLHSLPADDVRAIQVLRTALASETHVIGRHFIYAELEAALYRCRKAFSSALADYDSTCRQHDAEMDRIRSACMAEWGKIPVIETYRQMAIRQQKLHDYARALWWAERGLAIYGDDAARPEVVEDLRHRTANYRAKLGA